MRCDRSTEHPGRARIGVPVAAGGCLCRREKAAALPGMPRTRRLDLRAGSIDGRSRCRRRAAPTDSRSCESDGCRFAENEKGAEMKEDDQIHRNLTSELESDSRLAGAEIAATVHDGVVTLRG